MSKKKTRKGQNLELLEFLTVLFNLLLVILNLIFAVLNLF
ncbi:hypothetical protein SAMN05660467_00666 [Peptostreptococcus anaerobius]|nr:hypothetical protein SAMN05660467_00666 [Peptostreptococcus anaerobius]